MFTISAGEIALFTASGFAAERVRVSASEMVSPQVACLHRIGIDYAEGQPLTMEPSSSCDFAVVNSLVQSVIYDEPVYANGCTVGVSKCKNILLFGLPGTYYFHLNDTTAIGKAQVWLEVLKSKDLPLRLLDSFMGA